MKSESNYQNNHSSIKKVQFKRYWNEKKIFLENFERRMKRASHLFDTVEYTNCQLKTERNRDCNKFY